MLIGSTTDLMERETSSSHPSLRIDVCCELSSDSDSWTYEVAISSPSGTIEVCTFIAMQTRESCSSLPGIRQWTSSQHGQGDAG